MSEWNETAAVDDVQPQLEQLIELDFPYDGEKYDPEEFVIQGFCQQETLNGMSVGELLENQERYQKFGRVPESADFQKEFRTAAQEEFAEKFGDERAKELLDGKAALHGLDQVAGGRADDVYSLGDRRVNSALGGLWSAGRAAELYEGLQEAAKDLTEEQLWEFRPNVRLDMYPKE